jgi:hypothetical protein
MPERPPLGNARASPARRGTGECTPTRRALSSAPSANEDDEIFPDPMSEAIAEGWRSSAVKAFQRQLVAEQELSSDPKQYTYRFKETER